MALSIRNAKTEKLARIRIRILGGDPGIAKAPVDPQVVRIGSNEKIGALAGGKPAHKTDAMRAHLWNIFPYAGQGIKGIALLQTDQRRYKGRAIGKLEKTRVCLADRDKTLFPGWDTDHLGFRTLRATAGVCGLDLVSPDPRDIWCEPAAPLCPAYRE